MICRWKEKGWIYLLKRGLYELTYPEDFAIPDMYIANKLYNPSYVSLETALSNYSIIPEVAMSVTSITTKPTRRFKNKHGLFIYRTVKPDVFTRFSANLDFNTNTITKKEFENLSKKIKDELRRMGMKPQVRFAHWKNVYASKLIFPAIEKAYNVVSRYSKKEGIIIKVETNRPKWKIENETQVISGFGEFYPCVCTAKGVLFADRIDALMKKNRGRHLYDIIFMLSNKHPVDKNILKALGIKSDPLKLIGERVKNFSKTELKREAEVLRPFLFDEEEAGLLVRAHDIVPPLLEKYRK